jgi:hypothetical protein
VRVYSVRSAYRALVINSDQQGAQGMNATSSSVGEEELWKKLWKLRVVPRVRTFWWRVLRGLMPDYITLSRHHIRDDSTCRIRNTTEEDSKHALV